MTNRYPEEPWTDQLLLTGALVTWKARYAPESHGVELLEVHATPGQVGASIDVDMLRSFLDGWANNIGPMSLGRFLTHKHETEPFQVIAEAFTPLSPTTAELVTDVVEEAGRRARRRLTPEHLAEVAEVYNSHPDKPTQAVMNDPRWRYSDDTPLPRPTASRWIRAARDAGLIEERK